MFRKLGIFNSPIVLVNDDLKGFEVIINWNSVVRPHVQKIPPYVMWLQLSMATDSHGSLPVERCRSENRTGFNYTGMSLAPLATWLTRSRLYCHSIWKQELPFYCCSLAGYSVSPFPLAFCVACHPKFSVVVTNYSLTFNHLWLLVPVKIWSVFETKGCIISIVRVGRFFVMRAHMDENTVTVR
jgi:hypothetical protein